MTDSGYLGAFITKVKKGSVADCVARLKPGDEVVMWNGKNLRNLSFDDVYDVIFASQNDVEVELAVERRLMTLFQEEEIGLEEDEERSHRRRGKHSSLECLPDAPKKPGGMARRTRDGSGGGDSLLCRRCCCFCCSQMLMTCSVH